MPSHMALLVEHRLDLPDLVILQVEVQWRGWAEFRPLVRGYHLCQRLSADHGPVQFADLGVPPAFAHERALGLLPADFEVRVLAPERPFRGLNCIWPAPRFEATTGLSAEDWAERSAELLSLRIPVLDQWMRLIRTELAVPGFGSELALEAAAILILVEIGRLLRRREARERPRGGLAGWQLARIRERVAAGPQLGFPTLAELARLCGLSRRQLMRAFKASTGLTVQRYVAEVRTELARRWLAEELPVSEVARRLGYGSSTHFATAFRRETGMSPGEYRRRTRADTSRRAVTIAKRTPECQPPYSPPCTPPDGGLTSPETRAERP